MLAKRIREQARLVDGYWETLLLPWRAIPLPVFPIQPTADTKEQAGLDLKHDGSLPAMRRESWLPQDESAQLTNTPN
jgi:hypothetical protein